MTLGTLNHLGITVSDRSRSEPFYATVLQFMGYQQVEKNDEFIMWWSKDAGAIVISAANPNSPNKIHDHYSPGLHHLAFNADSREQVDNLMNYPAHAKNMDEVSDASSPLVASYFRMK